MIKIPKYNNFKEDVGDYKYRKRQCSAHFLKWWEGVTQLSPRKCVNRNSIQESKNTLRNYLFSECKLERYFLSRVCHCLLTLKAKWQRKNEGSWITTRTCVLSKHRVVLHCCHHHLLIPASLLHLRFSLVQIHCLHPFQTCFKTGFDIWKYFKIFWKLFQPLVN